MGKLLSEARITVIKRSELSRTARKGGVQPSKARNVVAEYKDRENRKHGVHYGGGQRDGEHILAGENDQEKEAQNDAQDMAPDSVVAFQYKALDVFGTSW